MTMSNDTRDFRADFTRSELDRLIERFIVERVALRTERDRLQAELDGSERARKNVSAALVIAKEWIEQKDERIHALEEALRWTWSRLDSGDSVVHELGCRRSHLDDEEKPERVCTCGYAAARTLLAPRESGEGEKADG